VLRETAPGVSVQQVLAATGATLAVADDVTEMHIEGVAS
jgi:3-oxoacid CoA-transferase subunit B